MEILIWHHYYAPLQLEHRNQYLSINIILYFKLERSLLCNGGLSPSWGRLPADTTSCFTPGFRLIREKGHSTPSVERISSVGAGGSFFSSATEQKSQPWGHWGSWGVRKQVNSTCIDRASLKKKSGQKYTKEKTLLQQVHKTTGDRVSLVKRFALHFPAIQTSKEEEEEEEF